MIVAFAVQHLVLVMTVPTVSVVGASTVVAAPRYLKYTCSHMPGKLAAYLRRENIVGVNSGVGFPRRGTY